jgi:hypothetical protein
LSSFEALARETSVMLTWETASEINNAGFEVERAIDAGAFAPLGFVGGRGTTTDPQVYRFEDRKLPFEAQQLRYRLKQLDFDGGFEYSETVHADRSGPEVIALLPNYLNPFNPTTKIRYELPVEAQVRLAVYDISGKEVAVLVDRQQEAGRHQIVWDGAEMASGVYVYVLQTPPSVQRSHMLLLK